MSRAMIAALLASALLIPVVGYCESGVKWGASDKQTRAPIAGMKTYYEPESVKKDNDVLTIKTYVSDDPADKTEAEQYSINCETHESSTKAVSAGEWQKPARLFAGEALYPLARELCEWGPGFWKRLAD